MNSLYFIAIEPHPDLSREIRNIQLDFKNRFNSRKAYDSFPHITLIPPFHRAVGSEPELIKKFMMTELPAGHFRISLNGFGSFSNRKNPVIYIKPEYSENLVQLQRALAAAFGNIQQPFHPHVTVAYKDLNANNFESAWKEYGQMSFNSSFSAEAVGLYKHFDRKWNLIAKKESKKP